MDAARTEGYPRVVSVPDITISSLIDKVCSYAPEGVEELIADAYCGGPFAAHRGQARKSGEPFVYHPLATAEILADLRLDAMRPSPPPCCTTWSRIPP